MKLLPSLKEKKRYILFEILSEKSFSTPEVETAVRQALQAFLGVLGVARALPMLMKIKNNKFIIRVGSSYVDECKSALILLKEIEKRPVILRSVVTSGMLNKAVKSLEGVS